MTKYSPQNIINFCLLGSSSSGKTSIAEALLYTAGLTDRLGNVEDGTTICDFNDDEIERKMSLSNSIVSFVRGDKKINLIDTPGYPDFFGEVISAAHVSDAVILVINAETGVDTATENIFDVIQNKPIVILLNKLDKVNTVFTELISIIENRLSIRVTPLQIPVNIGSEYDTFIDLLEMQQITADKKSAISDTSGSVREGYEKMIESIASCDDTLIEKYLEGGTIEKKELYQGLRVGFTARKIFPLLCFCATRTIGAEALLNFISDFFPGSTVSSGDDFSGIVFKTLTEPGMGQMNYIKVFSGSIKPGMDIYNATKQIWERVGQLCFLQGKKRIDTQSVSAGDIVVAIKLKQTRTNDLLSLKKDNQINIDRINFPTPVVEMAIYPKSKGEEEKIANALSAMVIEDPTLDFKYNTETKEMIVSGLGDMQFEVMINRIKKRYGGIEVELHRPKVPYKETLKGVAEVQGKYKRQSGGRGQYGDCWLRVEPLERGKGFEFVDKIFGGAIPKNYIPAVQKGVLEAMSEGVIAGYPVVDVRVTLYDGSYHEVDSSDLAFKIAGSMALKKGVAEANPCILEPIMNLEVNIPEEYLGSVIGDLNSRRGKILGMEKSGKRQVVKAYVPLAELSTFAADLRSMTKGAGKFAMTFAYYDEVPGYIAQALIDQYQKSKQKE